MSSSLVFWILQEFAVEWCRDIQGDKVLHNSVSHVCISFIAGSAGGAALHGLVQDLLHVLEAQVPPHLAHSQLNSRRHAAVGKQTQASIGWQGRAAAAVVALTEVLYGASPAWQPAHTQNSTNPYPHGNSSLRPNGVSADQGNLGMAANDQSDNVQQKWNIGNTGHQPDMPASGVGASAASDRVLERLVVQVVDDFCSAGIWRLPTHADPDGPLDTAAGATPLMPQVSCLATALEVALCMVASISPHPCFTSSGQ